MGRVENEAVARGLNEAFEQRDMQRLNALLADDVVWHQIGRPDLRGKAALRAAPQPGAGADYDITGRAHDVLASDDHAVVLTQVTASRAGKTLSYRTAEIYHIRGGQVTERWAFSDDTAAITRFFA
jgi:ketosteroid isomerase-like protein